MRREAPRGPGGNRLRWFLAFAALALVACGGDDEVTQLIVLVDTDYVVPDELSVVRAHIYDSGGTETQSHDFSLFAPGGGRLSVPFSFGIVPSASANGDHLTLVVEGHTASPGRLLVSRRAVTGFVKGETRLLPMFLARRCETEAATCAQGQTCSEVGCVNEEIPPEDLDLVIPGQELDASTLRPETGPPDARPDADARIDADARRDADADADAAPDADAGMCFAEVCNGEDDDCNGECDETFACCAGSSERCITECGSEGQLVCSATCERGAVCETQDESCNGVDDDCDMSIDEGFGCISGRSTACMTSCGSMGMSTCTADCMAGACTPPEEQCGNMDDDDCDMQVDEGCMVGCDATCPGANLIDVPGGRFTGMTGSGGSNGSCGGTGGSERIYTFTLDSESDVFITTHGSAVDTVLYVRQCSCTGTEVGCNDDADGLTTSTLQLTSLPGGTYTIFVDTKAPMSAMTSLDVYISTPGVAGDRCGRPTFVPAGATTISGESCGSSGDYTPTVNGSGADDCYLMTAGNANESVFYFYLPTARTISWSSCNGLTLFDNTVYVRDVCSTEGLANQRACNDDGCTGPSGCNRYRSEKDVMLPAGLYYLFADGYQTSLPMGCPSCGSFSLDVSGF